MGWLFDKMSDNDWTKKSKEELIKQLIILQETIQDLEKKETERKISEKSLQQELDFTMRMIHSSPTYFITLTIDGKTLMMNETMLHKLGYKSSEIVGKNCLDTFMAPEDRDIINVAFKSMFANKKLTIFTARSITKNNVYFLIEWYCTSVSTNSEFEYIFAVGIDVTERKQAEDAVEKLEQKFKTLAEESPNMIFIHKDGHIVYANKKCTEIMGYSREEFYAPDFDFFVLIVPESHNTIKHVLKEHAKAVDVRPYDLALVTRNGRKLQTIISSKNIDYEGGTAILGIITDITEYTQLLDRLRESEEKYHNVVEQSMVGLVIIQGIPPRLVYVNKAFCNILGYSQKELMAFTSQDIVGLIPLEDQSDILKRYQEVISGATPRSREARFIHKDSNIRTLEILGKSINYQGKPAIQMTVIDITEHKQAEEARHVSEQKYRHLVEQSLQGIIIVQDYRIVFTNKAFAEMSGYTAEEILNMSPENVRALVHSDYQKFVWTRWQARIDGKDVEPHYEYIVIAKDGTNKWLDMYAQLVDYRGKPAVQALFIDITHRKELEILLKDNVVKLHKIMENTINSMASIVETRDPYTAGHQRRVAQLATTIAAEMNLSEDQIAGLNMAAIIHDIGKIHVPAEILTRPGQLSIPEFALIKTHPRVGYEILKRVEFPWPVATIVLQHHERFNGTGYPEGLKGNDVIVEARILAVADVVEAMSSHRPYRPAHTMDESLKEIDDNKGILYDPLVVDICLKLFKEKKFTFET